MLNASTKAFWYTIYILASDFFEKFAFKTGFSVHNINLYLCWQLDDTKWILCCRKIGVKCAGFKISGVQNLSIGSDLIFLFGYVHKLFHKSQINIHNMNCLI